MKKYIFLMLMAPCLAYAVRFLPVQLFPTACDMSTSSCNSIGVDLNQLQLASIQAVFTGSPVGTMKIQISNDNVAACMTSNPGCNVVNWTDYSGSSQAVAAAGDFQYNLTTVGYHWIRFVYTKTSGTGSLTAMLSAKGWL